MVKRLKMWPTLFMTFSYEICYFQDKCRALCFVQNCSWIGNIYFYVLFGKTLFLGKFVRAKYVVPSNIKRLSNVVPTLQSTLMIKYQYFYSFSSFTFTEKYPGDFFLWLRALPKSPILCQGQIPGVRFTNISNICLIFIISTNALCL